MSAVPSTADRVRADFSAYVTAHDFGHLERVARMAARIAAYVHEYHRVVGHLEGGILAPEDVWDRIEPILVEAGVEEAVQDEVRSAVELTSRYSFAGDSLEGWPVIAQGVHDADNEASRGIVCLGFGASKEIDQRCTVTAHATVTLVQGGDVVEASLTGLPSYVSDQLAPYRSARRLPLTDRSLLFVPEQGSPWIRSDGRTAAQDLREGHVIAQLSFSSGALVQARLEFTDPVFDDDKEEEPGAVL